MYASTDTFVSVMGMICMVQFKWLKIDYGNPCVLNQDNRERKRLQSFGVQKTKLRIWLIKQIHE